MNSKGLLTDYIECYVLHSKQNSAEMKTYFPVGIDKSSWCAYRILEEAYKKDDMLQRAFRSVDDFVKHTLDGDSRINFSFITYPKEDYTDAEEKFRNFLLSVALSR